MKRRNGNGITMNRAFAKLLSDGSEVERLSARVAELEGVRDELSKIGVDQRTRIAELETGLRLLLNYAEKQTCLHEETHRAGTIWEICDMCGRRWADDRGGKPEYEEPEAFTNAHALLNNRMDHHAGVCQQVIPESGGHIESADCWCRPTVEEHPGGTLIIHNQTH